jgi:hypothetical protein
MSVMVWLALLGLWGAVSAALLVVSMLFTNPITVGPAGVTTWFVILYSSLVCLATIILYFTKTYLHIHATRVSRLRYSWRQGLLIAGWASAMLALASLRQLGYLDAILLGLLLVIVEIYVRFRWP